MDLVGYAIMLQNALPIRIQHATDYDVQEASYDTIVMMRLQIKFRMQKVHADGISNAELEQTLQGELRRLSRNLAGLPAKEGVPLHTEVLRKVQAVSISKISRAANPDEDYAEMLNLGAKTRP